MKEWGSKILVFLTTLAATFTGILPASGCTGGCGSCFKCAGVGGVAAILIAIGVAGKKKEHGKEYHVAKTNN